MLFFGIGEAPAIVIIFLAAFFPVLLATIAAVQKLDPIYLKVAQNFGIGTPAIFTKIILPPSFRRSPRGFTSPWARPGSSSSRARWSAHSRDSAFSSSTRATTFGLTC